MVNSCESGSNSGGSTSCCGNETERVNYGRRLSASGRDRQSFGTNSFSAAAGRGPPPERNRRLRPLQMTLSNGSAANGQAVVVRVREDLRAEVPRRMLQVRFHARFRH